jgi:hypothetical protein
MTLPLAYAFLDVAAVEEVAVDVWTEVFEATGWPMSLAEKKGPINHADIVDALRIGPLTDELLHALETLHELGSDAGRDAIVAAMNDRHIPLDTISQNSGEKEFSLRFYLAQRKDAALVDVFARAQIQIQEGGDQKRYNDFLGKDARSFTSLSAKKDALREQVLEHCKKSDLGEHVHVQAFEDDGVFVFNVLRSHHTRKPLAVVPGQTARTTIQYRPVHADILRYEASVGRLRIAARATSMVDFYRRTLGAVLFGDQAFFDGNSVCSLDVITQRGRSALESHNVLSVGRVWMTECLWERGDRNLLLFRSNDCFRSIEELNLTLAEGRLLQAKLKVQVIGKSTRPVTVNIRVPSRIEVSQKSHELLIEKLLKAVGIYNAAALASTVSFWSLYPWRHPIAAWRTLLGKDTDELIQKGVLNPIRLESVAAAENPAAGRVLSSHPLSDGEYYGVSHTDEIPSRTLSATDLDGFELIPEKLRLYLRSRLGIANGGSVWDGNETLDLGSVELGIHKIHVVYALRQPAPGIGDQMRVHSSGALSVLLIPACETYKSELASVPLDSALPSKKDVIRGAIGACSLTDSIPAIHRCPDGARLVVDTHLKKVWIDEVEVAGLQPDSQSFRFVEAMARSQGPVSSEQLSSTLSPGRLDGSTTARQAKNQVKKIITDAMHGVARNFDEDPFPSAGPGSYRCAFPAYIV